MPNSDCPFALQPEPVVEAPVGGIVAFRDQRPKMIPGLLGSPIEEVVLHGPVKRVVSQFLNARVHHEPQQVKEERVVLSHYLVSLAAEVLKHVVVRRLYLLLQQFVLLYFLMHALLVVGRFFDLHLDHALHLVREYERVAFSVEAKSGALLAVLHEVPEVDVEQSPSRLLNHQVARVPVTKSENVGGNTVPSSTLDIHLLVVTLVLNCLQC